MTEPEKALYADVCWMKQVMEVRRSDAAKFRSNTGSAVLVAALELKGTLSKYLEAERTKNFTAEDHEAERNGGRR